MNINRIDIQDPMIVEHVQRYLAANETFEISANVNFKHHQALLRALSSLKSADDRRVGFLDMMRLSKILGCLGLVNDKPGYTWTYCEGINVVQIACEFAPSKLPNLRS